jgi:hypothetical protein
MKNIFRIVFSAAILTLFITGCSKTYLDVNDNPNIATDENVTAELLFPQAASAAGGLQTNFAFLDHWMGYVSPNGDYARDQTETSYNIDFTFSNGVWFNYYNTLFDLHLVKTKALVEGGDTALAAASMIISAKLFQDLVDVFGDIPYSQAFKNSESQHPAYDKAQDIYKDLLASLDTAIEYMNMPAPISFSTVDIAFHGDQTEWIKAANTIRLRILLRQAAVDNSKPSDELNKIQQTGGVLGSGESFSVNPGYINELNKQSPIYSVAGYTPEGTKATAVDAANAYIINILSSSNDPRISRFFLTAGGSYVGNVYGDAPGNMYSGANTSYFGPGIAGSASQDQWIIPSFESMFLKAEAVARGWLPGDVKTSYEDAVTESFVWLGVPNAETEAAAYLNNADIANWDNAGSSTESQIKFIVYQKYIAMCVIDPLEAWCDQRSLHFLPDNDFISANPSRISNTLPVRLLYPQTEYTTNSENVQAEGNIDQFSSKIFWQP